MPTNANRPIRRRKVVSHYSDENPSTFTKKRKGVPPSPTPPPPAKKTEPPSSSTSSRKRKSPPTLPPQADDIAMSHARIIHPVFPIQELVAPSASNHAASHSVLLGGSNNNNNPALPTWKSLTSHTHEYADDSIGTTMITWLSVREDREDYAVAGDCHGALALMRHTNATRTIAVIRTTSAAKRDREVVQKRKVYPNAIVQCAWSHDLIVVLTKSELECLSVATKSILCGMSIVADSRKYNVQTPVLALRKDSLLWTTGQWGMDKVPSGSLLLWESCMQSSTTSPTTPTVLSLEETGSNTRYLAALWEKAESSRSFFCVCQANDDATELLRCHSEDSGIIRAEHRQSLPVTGRNFVSEYTLQQFDEYVFVSGKGIRMYNANDLSFVATYGENVQLHGKIVIWSRCCWLPAPRTKQNELRVSKKSCWIEQADALAEPDQEGVERDYWLMGVPHPFKGPEELQSNLYVWQRDGASTFLKSIAKGCASDIWVNRDTWKTVALSPETGDLKQFADSSTTDFSGVMYPVGYNVITDNIEYIEDEDELDQVLPNSDTPMLGLYDEDPILEDEGSPNRMESSNQKPIYIDVVAEKNDEERENHVICWPEAVQFGPDDADPGSPKRSERRFPLLPQIDGVKHEMATCNDDEIEMTKSKPAPGKKRLEAIKQSSINSQLRNAIKMRRGQWSESKGSALDPSQLKHSLEEKTLAMELLFLSPGQKRQHAEADDSDTVEAKDELSCPACLGRMRLHTCGKREMPIDYDALAREELARREREEAEKMRIKTKRRKEAELKRREAKKKKKMEEERLRNEQIQADRAAAVTQVALSRNGAHPSKPDTNNEEYNFHQSPSLFSNRDTPSFPPTLKIDGNEVMPSTSLDPTDALSALAGLADSLSAQPNVGQTDATFLSDHGKYQGSQWDPGLSETPEAQLDAMFAILPVHDEGAMPDQETTQPQSSNSTLVTNTNSKDKSASTQEGDVGHMPHLQSAPSNDITFHTVPGSSMPIMTETPVVASIAKADDERSTCTKTAPTSPLLSPVNGSASGFLSPSGLSAIAMLSETAARQAILDGEQNGLIPTSELAPEQLNGKHEPLGEKNNVVSDQRLGDADNPAASESSGIKTDSQG